MDAFVGLGGLTAVVLTILWGAIVLAKRSRNQDVSATSFGALDEVFHPAAHQASIVVDEQREVSPPLPTPDD